MRFLLIALFCLFSSMSIAQKLPHTSLYLFDMQTDGDSLYRFSNPKFLSNFNPEGYTNQPNFINDDEVMVTVQKLDDTTQSDIYKINILEMTLARFTKTAESEFSPTLVLSDYNAPDRFLSTVRVETDGKTQKLWQYPMNRSNTGNAVFRTLQEIGYHYWMTPKDVLLFIVGNPHRLVSANTTNEATFEIASNIGRCMQRLPNGDVAYVQKANVGEWLIKRLTKTSFYTEYITPTVPGSEDFVVLDDGTIIMAGGTKLYKFTPGNDTNWLEIGDFSYYGFQTISRMAVRGDKLLMVTQ